LSSWLRAPVYIVFFFQAEDGIRDFHVTGVQTCALPISGGVSAAAINCPSATTSRPQTTTTLVPCAGLSSSRARLGDSTPVEPRYRRASVEGEQCSWSRITASVSPAVASRSTSSAPSAHVATAGPARLGETSARRGRTVPT